MPLPPLPSSLGHQVTTRQFSLLEMVSRAWGSEFQAPDHGVYVWSNGRRFDSTDQGFTGIYSRNIPMAIPPPVPQATTPVLSGQIVSGLDFTMVAGQIGDPCCTCPCQSAAVVGFTTADVGAAIGSIAPTTLDGNPVWALQWSAGVLSLIISGTLPQSEFVTLTLHDSDLGSLAFNAVDAMFAHANSGVPPNPAITVWQWIPAGRLFTNAGTYHLTVT